MVNFTLFLQKFLNRKVSFGQKRVHFSKSCLFHFWFTAQLRRGAFFFSLGAFRATISIQEAVSRLLVVNLVAWLLLLLCALLSPPPFSP